jgi:hypothetical protein
MAAAKAHAKTEGLVGDIKSALHGFHGAGEVIRGTSMEALDGVFHKREGEARNKEIAERGLAEMEPGWERIHQVEGEHAHSHSHSHGHVHGHGVAAGAGSHFAREREHEHQVGHQEAGDRIALGAARKATAEEHERSW